MGRRLLVQEIIGAGDYWCRRLLVQEIIGHSIFENYMGGRLYCRKMIEYITFGNYMEDEILWAGDYKAGND